MLITNPLPNSWKYSVYKFCLDVMKWQLDQRKDFLVIAPPDSGFAQFLTWKTHQKDRIKYHFGCIHVDMTNYCHCDPSIKDLRVHYNYEDDFELMEPQHAFSREESFGQIHTGNSYRHVCVHSLHTSRNLFHGRT